MSGVLIKDHCPDLKQLVWILTVTADGAVLIAHRVLDGNTSDVDQAPLARDAASDGCYPLIRNDRDLTGAQLLAAYKYQPNLEKRHAQLKGTQLVAPVFLHDPARIEALLRCHFIAMLIHVLIERQIRQAMKSKEIKQLSLYPEDRGCPAPTAARILDIFTSLARHPSSTTTVASSRASPPSSTNYSSSCSTHSKFRTALHRLNSRWEPNPVREMRKVS
jgi:hypothetical protein